jgi:RimJ/RimL family protein N-acetyltransferase
MPELPFPDPPLTDGVITLRPWRRSDIHHRFAGFSDPLCLRFSWPLAEPFTEAHVQARFEDEEAARLRGDELNLTIVERDQVQGGASIYDVDLEQARAAVGFWLAPQGRGRGLATRTLRLLARWAFAHLSLERLELTCAPDNLASQHVAERCGFVREGVLRSHLRFQGRRRDTMVFSLLPHELRTPD